MSTTNHIKTEAHLTTFEAISMIVGNSNNINNALEEKEREEFTRLKVIKRRQ